MNFLTWRRRFIILFANIFVLALFLGLGYLIDQQLGSWPAAFIIGFILSFPAAIALLFYLIKKDMAREIEVMKEENL